MGLFNPVGRQPVQNQQWKHYKNARVYYPSIFIVDFEYMFAP